jgi:hypothetical protein
MHSNFVEPKKIRFFHLYSEQVLSPVLASEIPEHLKVRFENEKKREHERQIEQEEANFYCETTVSLGKPIWPPQPKFLLPNHLVDHGRGHATPSRVRAVRPQVVGGSEAKDENEEAHHHWGIVQIRGHQHGNNFD